jgi:hypothetical protein
MGLPAGAATAVAPRVTPLPVPPTAPRQATSGSWPTGSIPTTPTRAQAIQLLGRFGFGATSADIAYVLKNGVVSWWNNQISRGMSTPGYKALPQLASVGSLLGQTPAQVRAWQAANGNEYGWDLMMQVSKVTLGLQAASPNQLYESVVDFFANHLNVANYDDSQTWVRHTMDRDVIRKYAFGSFTDMLLASAKNPAMLLYLNLAESTKASVNENYGRELLELHTVGVGAGYTEQMVKDSAKILTGRRLTKDYTYVYQPQQHPTGPVQVLGFSDANDSATAGETLGDNYLRYLASHPATANNLARKLCVHYVSDNPSPSLIAAVAQVYLANGTAIVPTVRAILTSAEFWASAGQKVRRPTENLYASQRIMDARMGSDAEKATETLWWMTRTMGNGPLEWSPPNGYPDVAAAWRSSSNLLQLWQFHRGIAQNWWKDAFVVPPNTTLYGSSKPATSGEAIRIIAMRLLGTEMTPTQQAALQTFIGEPANTPLASSKLRWELDAMVPLFLDSPYHAKR